jgi:hypothetical protein
MNLARNRGRLSLWRARGCRPGTPAGAVGGRRSGPPDWRAPRAAGCPGSGGRGPGGRSLRSGCLGRGCLGRGCLGRGCLGHGHGRSGRRHFGTFRRLARRLSSPDLSDCRFDALPTPQGSLELAQPSSFKPRRIGEPSLQLAKTPAKILAARQRGLLACAARSRRSLLGHLDPLCYCAVALDVGRLYYPCVRRVGSIATRAVRSTSGRPCETLRWSPRSVVSRE